MFLSFNEISALTKSHPRLFSIREHIDANSPLGHFFLDNSFETAKAYFEDREDFVIKEFEDPDAYSIIGNASSMLFKFRLANKLGISEEEFVNHASFREASKTLLGEIGDVVQGWRTDNLEEIMGKESLEALDDAVKNGFSEYVKGISSDVGKAIFLSQVDSFSKYKDFGIFRKDWSKDEELCGEIDFLVSRALSKLEPILKDINKDTIDFFPVFVSGGGIFVRGGILVKDMLVDFYCGQSLNKFPKRLLAINKACFLMDKSTIGGRVRECFLYNFRYGQLFSLS